MATIAVGVVVAIGISNLFSSERGGMRDGPQTPGTGQVQGTGQGDGQRDSGSVETTTGSLLGFGPLEGEGTLQGNALLAGAGPLQGNAPVFGGGLTGVGNPITGINGPPPTPVTPVSLPTVPVTTLPTDPPPAPVTPLPDLGPEPPPSSPTAPAVGDPQVSPTSRVRNVLHPTDATGADAAPEQHPAVRKRDLQLSSNSSRSAPHTMLKPPLMLTTWPVIQAPASEARSDTIGATSEGWPRRRVG